MKTISKMLIVIAMLAMVACGSGTKPSDSTLTDSTKVDTTAVDSTVADSIKK